MSNQNERNTLPINDAAETLQVLEKTEVTKKPFVEPSISESLDVLSTTKFFQGPGEEGGSIPF